MAATDLVLTLVGAAPLTAPEIEAARSALSNAGAIVGNGPTLG